MLCLVQCSHLKTRACFRYRFATAFVLVNSEYQSEIPLIISYLTFKSDIAIQDVGEEG